MTQVDRIHPGDLAISGIVAVTQYQIGRFLFTDWRKRLAPFAFFSLAAILSALWAIIGFAVLCSLLYMFSELRWMPASMRSFESGVEHVWGMISVAALIVYLIYRWLARRPAIEHSPGRRHALQTAAIAAMTAPAAVVGYGALIEREKFRITEIDLPLPNLHPDLDGLRVAQISDLHVSPFLSVRDAGRAVDIANSLKPHLTLVTGDLISEPGDPLDATIAEIARLRADLGVLGCMGNHEVYALCEDYTERECARRGIEFLRARHRRIRWGNGAMNVAGVDFQRFGIRDHYLAGAESLVVPGMANLLLSHNPDVFPTAVRKGYDAVVGGHTHGGQVTVEILNQTLNFARFFTPYVAGLYRLNGRSCYVNCGIGTIGMPVRVGAPPEITLLRLRKV